jgi:hypothetical protein
MKISINGRSYETDKSELSYEEVIRMTDEIFRDDYTMVYHKSGVVDHRDGILHKGQKIAIQEGTRFEFIMTNNA